MATRWSSAMGWAIFMLVWTVVGPTLGGTAPTNRELIQQALNEPSRISLTDIKLSDAIDEILKQTGVKVVMKPDVLRLAPQGGNTQINKVDIANLPLREGLTRLFAPLGMTFVVGEDHVEVVPRDALIALGRAPTWIELDTLGWIASVQPGIDDKALDALRDRVQFQVGGSGAWRSLAENMEEIGAGSGDEVLTAACRKLGWEWTIADRNVVVASAENQIRRRLAVPISVTIRNRTLFEAMSAIGDAARVHVEAEPGALVSLPLQIQKNFSLDVRNRTAQQALDEIAAYTGLGYVAGPEGVLFYRAAPGGGTPISPTGGSGTSDPYVAKMTIPLDDGKSIEWLIRKSELPDDVQKLRERDLENLIEELREKTAAMKQP